MKCLNAATPIVLGLLVLAGGLGPDHPAWAGGEAQSARLMSAAVTSGERGRADLLLGLRRLRDPALSPFFGTLLTSKDSRLRRQGLLGLAELNDPPSLNFMDLARLPDPAERAAALGESLSLDLVQEAQLHDLLEIEQLDPYVELVVRGRLPGAADAERLRTLAGSGGPVQRVIAALLLAKAGDASLLAGSSTELLALEEPARGAKVGLLLEHIRREKLTGAGPVLQGVLKVYGEDATLRADILRTWLLSDSASASEAWTQTLASSGELSSVLRLAMAALDSAAGVKPELFAQLLESDRPALVRTIAEAGLAIASKSGEPAALAKLGAAAYGPADLWIVQSSRAWPEAWTRAACGAILDRAQGSGGEGSFSDALPGAVERLALLEGQPGLREAVASAVTRRDDRAASALLSGLLLARSGVLWETAKPVRWPGGSSKALATVIEARSDPAFAKDAARMKRLAQVASGVEGRLPPQVEVQAEWLHARLSGEGATTIARVVAGLKE
jgi:hypothetical protein